MVLCIQCEPHLVSGIMSMWSKQREPKALLEEISSITHFYCIDFKQLLYNDMLMLEMKELFFHLLQFCVCACEIVLCSLKVAKRLSFLIVSRNELYRYSL